MILDSSMVEHSAVNRVVVGSSPTRGVNVLNHIGTKVLIKTCKQRNVCFLGVCRFFIYQVLEEYETVTNLLQRG